MQSKSTNAAKSRKNPAKGRSAITNGNLLLTDITDADGRGIWHRRFRDLVNLHTSDLGGPDVVSESEKFLIRRCATLNTELERMEIQFAEAGQSTLQQLETYQRASNSLRRLLLALGLQRRSKDITPTLAEYLRDLEQRRSAQQPQVQEADGD